MTSALLAAHPQLAALVLAGARASWLPNGLEPRTRRDPVSGEWSLCVGDDHEPFPPHRRGVEIAYLRLCARAWDAAHWEQREARRRREATR